jgi:hypothetical protein
LSGQNLTHADLRDAVLTGADLSAADARGANFQYAILTDANLSGADARGADFQFATLTGATTSNLIQSNGHIAGLDLTAGATLAVRDYDGNAGSIPPTGPLPIVVDQHLTMDATGALRLVFDADPWDSTISFAPGIPVALGGTLELMFADDVNPASQVGRTFDLFDWTDVTPLGAFTVASHFTWDLSALYTSGEVTLTATGGLIPGDFNNDGTVDAADYVVWRKTDGTQAGYELWRANFGATAALGATAAADSPLAAVPEPASVTLAVLAAWMVVQLRWPLPNR